MTKLEEEIAATEQRLKSLKNEAAKKKEKERIDQFESNRPTFDVLKINDFKYVSDFWFKALNGRWFYDIKSLPKNPQYNERGDPEWLRTGNCSAADTKGFHLKVVDIDFTRRHYVDFVFALCDSNNTELMLLQIAAYGHDDMCSTEFEFENSEDFKPAYRKTKTITYYDNYP